MTELTEAEIERLYANDPGAYLSGTMVAAICDLIDARLAPIRALADKWHGSGSCSPSWCYACRLIAALSGPQDAPQPTSGTEGQDEAQ